MPTAREALLDAALSALETRPWTAVRMVDVAAAAGVSRQTLHNEFGGKDGLARALLRDAADGYLAGVERALASNGGATERLTATAVWTVRTVRANALVRGVLTGCWSERSPRPVRGGPPPLSPVPAQRRADAGTPPPAELLRLAGERAATVLGAFGPDPVARRPPHESAALAARCEIVLRLALSYALVPARPGTGRGPVPLVRQVLEGAPGPVV
ncbi:MULTISPECIES: TetR/AcrR family transcriptional regulator [unclassified Streptomyces]|uniref:TetR/AcrR family transcriptional regulator n=1 Tax=unclassified Streptomyces TaxID=2593676 RepID=UPI0011E7F659|nr:TetR/AcrR family transcriptional regulator [Streptomyces sp. sk2.1]TXS67209.1 TetR/AcrR family transcriptional regulator [Streptomyces sp. sk2.1]